MKATITGVRRAIEQWRIVPAAVAGLACLDDRSVSPDANAPVRLGLHATVVAAGERTVRIRAFYARLDSSSVTLESSPTEVLVTPGVSRRVAVQVHVAACLADSRRASSAPRTCPVALELSLVDDGGNILDRQTSRPSQPPTPGQTVPAGTPITLVEVNQVSVTPPPVFRVGEARSLTVTALDASGNPVAGREFTWSSDNASVATVHPSSGLVTAVGPGTARITATSGMKSGLATVRVIRRVASVLLSPDPAPGITVAGTRAFTATPKDESGADAGDLAERTITWRTTNPSGGSPTASVSPTGVVTGIFPGNVDVTVSIDGVTKTVRALVSAAEVIITPSAAQVIVGGTTTLRATAVDANRAPIANVPITWQSLNPSIATVNASGVVTGVAVGQAALRASGGNVSSSSLVNVVSPALDVTPQAANLTAGRTLQLNVTGAQGQVTWQTSSSAIATVSASGLVSARYPGTVTVTATTTSASGTQTGSMSLTVTAASVEVLPDTVFLLSGQSTQLSAIVRDANGVALQGVPVTWSVDNASVVIVEQTGQIHANNEGTTHVNAAAGGAGGSTWVIVSAPGYERIPAASDSSTAGRRALPRHRRSRGASNEEGE